MQEPISAAAVAPMEELRLLGADVTSLAEVPRLQVVGRQLHTLHLHGNRLVSIAGLHAACPLLEKLILSSNEIGALDGLSGLHRLRSLDLSSNCITSFEGLVGLEALEELFAAHNRVATLEGLAPLRGRGSVLRHLDLRDNSLERVAELLLLGGLEGLAELRLRARDGRRANPACRSREYPAAALCAAPDLSELDEEPVAEAEREAARRAPPAEVPPWPRRSAAVPAALLESPDAPQEWDPQIPGARCPETSCVSPCGLVQDATAMVAAHPAEALACYVCAAQQASEAARAPEAPAAEALSGPEAGEEARLAAHVEQLTALCSALQESMDSCQLHSKGRMGAGERTLRVLLAELRSLRRRHRQEMAKPSAIVTQQAANEKLLAELRVVASQSRRRLAAQEDIQGRLRSTSEEIRTCRQQTRLLQAEAASQHSARTSTRAVLYGANEQLAVATAASRHAAATAEALATCSCDGRLKLETVLHSFQVEVDELIAARQASVGAGELEGVRESEHQELEQQLLSLTSTIGAQEQDLHSWSTQRAEYAGEADALEQKLARRAEENLAGRLALHQATEEVYEFRSRIEGARGCANRLKSTVASQREAWTNKWEAAQRDALQAEDCLQLGVAKQLAEQIAFEQRFRRNHEAMVHHARRLEEQAIETHAEVRAREDKLQACEGDVKGLRVVVEQLESEVDQAQSFVAACHGQRELNKSAFRQELVRAEEWGAERCLAAELLLDEEHVRATAFVDAATHRADAQVEVTLISECAGYASRLAVLAADERRVAEAFPAERDAARFRQELELGRACVAAFSEEFRLAESNMGQLSEELQGSKEREASLRAEHVGRQASWKRAETDADARLRHARADEVAEVQAEEALREEVVRLEEASDARDEDLAQLLAQVGHFEEARGEESKNEQAELRELRGAGLHIADGASAQVWSLDAKLGEELRRHQVENRLLRGLIKEMVGQVAAYGAEEEAVADSWRAERQKQAHEAAALVADLQVGAVRLDGTA